MTNVGWINPGSTSFSNSSSAILPAGQDGSTGTSWRSASSARSGRSSVTSSPTASDTLPSTVTRRHSPAEIDLAAPERDLERAGHRERARLHEIARDLHHRLVVGVGPVELEHRELGVVLPAHALVAEVPPDLVDAFEAAHEQALEVQLERDPQVQVHVEIAVVRHERTRHRPARDRLEDRRLDLDVAVLVQVRADRAQRVRARVDQPPPRVGVGREVEGALSLLELGILEAVPLLGQRAEGLGEHREPLDEDRQLALARGPDPAGRTDDVAEIHLREQLAAVRRRCPG